MPDSRRQFLTRALLATPLAARTVPAIAAQPSRHAAKRAISGTAVAGRTTDPRIPFFVVPGGNAVDSAVATALIAAVQAPSQTGIGGYGLSAIVCANGSDRITAVDANSAAPQSLSSDLFRPQADGTVPGRINETGWLAAGVPGVLAGLQLLIDQFASLKLHTLLQPALKLARDGYPWPEGYARAIATRPIFATDPGSRQLYFRNGSPLAAGEVFRNPALADLLQTLADRNSVDDFYRGGIAQQLAAEFERNGGLVTAADLAAYQAIAVKPLILTHGNRSVCTPPLTAGGLSVLQMLKTWLSLPGTIRDNAEMSLHATAETMRWAWRDRLTLLGDPAIESIPVDRLLSDLNAQQSAAAIADAVQQKKILTHDLQPNGQSGTINISAADDQGNMIALTLTHGNGFGAGVTAAGLGLTLGHGMSRFDPRPGHPNGPRPGKKPLHNMVPVIALEGSQAAFAIGGAGGRKIPNSIFSVLRPWLAENVSLERALTEPRLHTEGTAVMEVTADGSVQKATLEQLGYTVRTAGSAALAAQPKL